MYLMTQMTMYLVDFYEKINSYKITQNQPKMFNTRDASIRERQAENKRLEEETKRMQNQLERIRKLKEMENQKLRLEQQMKSLNIEGQTFKKQSEGTKTSTLRSYGTKVAKTNFQKNEKKIKKMTQKLLESPSQKDSGSEQQDGQNVRYFLQVVGMQKYFPRFKAKKIYTLEKLRAVKTEDLKKLEIPIKDMVTINKKLRSMGIN